jgi:hypothetical protein
MIKMERTCNSLKCDVFFEGQLIGEMEGVSLIQWFLKNKYKYTGAFNRFITESEFLSDGMAFDVVFKGSRIVVKEVTINWIKGPDKNGTFLAKKIEYQDDIENF